MKKNYVIDTNVFLENHEAINVLRNHEENEVFVPKRVLLELDGLKNCAKVGHLAKRAIFEIEKNLDKITFIGEDIKENSDLKILNDIKNAKINDVKIENPILVTNDRIFRMFANNNGVAAEEFLYSLPFKSESEIYTGFLDSYRIESTDEKNSIKNYFIWKHSEDDQKELPLFHKHNHKPKFINWTNEIWKVKPKIKSVDSGEFDQYQNCAMQLLMDDDIKIMTIQSPAGAGKTFLALAAALENVLQKKRYKKIMFFKPIVESGENIGLLPGDIADKTNPYIGYIDTLMNKLYEGREFKRLYKKSANGGPSEYDPKMFSFVPVSFIRGMDIEDTFIIADEIQNYSRETMRTLLTRCGRNCKIVLLGDTNQVDNNRLNPLNNGMNWVVKQLKSSPIYAHIVLQGKHSRGPICDEVLRCEL